MTAATVAEPRRDGPATGEGRATMSERAPVPSRLFVSAFCMDGGFFLMLTAVPFKVLALGGGPVALGVAASVAAGSYVVLARVGGRWSDGPRRAAVALAGSLVLVLFAGAAARIGRLWLLVAALPLMSLGKAFYWPVVEAALADLSGPRRLEREVGRFNVAWSCGKTAGFAAGGLLLAGAGFGPTFLAGSLLAGVAFLSLPWRALAPPADRRRADAGAGPPAGGGPGDDVGSVVHGAEGAAAAAAACGPWLLGGGGRRPEEARRFRLMAWVANVAAFGAGGVLIHHLPKWFEALGWGAGRFGAVQAVVYLCQTAVFVLLAAGIRLGYSPGRLLVPQALALLALAAVPWLDSYWLVLLVAPAIGIAFGVAYTASIYHSLDAPSGRGRNAGIHESLVGLGGLLPPLLGGLAAAWTGWLGAPYLLAAATIGLALALELALWRRRRRRRPGGGGDPDGTARREAPCASG